MIIKKMKLKIILIYVINIFINYFLFCGLIEYISIIMLNEEKVKLLKNQQIIHLYSKIIKLNVYLTTSMERKIVMHLIPFFLNNIFNIFSKEQYTLRYLIYILYKYFIFNSYKD